MYRFCSVGTREVGEYSDRLLEHFTEQRAAKLEELRLVEITIRQIQKQLGEAPEEPSELVAATPGTPAAQIKPATGHSGTVVYKPRPDEFFGMSQAEAARTYLEKIGHAVLLDDLLKAVTSGGCKVGGADPKKTFYIGLVQNKRDFVPTGNGYFGLRKFYPNMPKLGRPEGTAPSKKASAKRGAKKSARHKANPKANRVKPKAHDPAEVRAAVSEALSDHKLKSPEEVLKAVERKVGHPVKKITVYGTLRKRDFEQIGDKYRLRQVGDGLQAVEVVQ
jgi:hypothetical protein